jgi:hypothetical protein
MFSPLKMRLLRFDGTEELSRSDTCAKPAESYCPFGTKPGQVYARRVILHGQTAGHLLSAICYLLLR